MSRSSLSPTVWLRTLAEFPQAGFCHTPQWARVVHEVWGGETAAVLQPTPDGQEALLPLVSRRLAGGRLRWTVSGETGVYGGPLLKAPMPANAWQDFWRDLSLHHGSITLFLPPGTVWESPRHGEGRTCQTHRLDLTAAAPDTGYNRGLKGALNRARRLGVTVVAGEGAADVDRYVSLYADTLDRWGDRTSWVRPAAYFHALLHYGQPHVRLWLALRDDEPVAGIWMAHFGREAHYLGGATARNGLQSYGSHLLLDHALHAAAAAGCRVFDFGASGDSEGLNRFKESFGAAPVPYGEVRLWATPMKLYWFVKDSWRKRHTATRAPGAAEEVTC